MGPLEDCVSLDLLISAGGRGIVTKPITEPVICRKILLMMIHVRMHPGHWLGGRRSTEDRDHKKDSGSH
jgi:hypothetical protein